MRTESLDESGTEQGTSENVGGEPARIRQARITHVGGPREPTTRPMPYLGPNPKDGETAFLGMRS